MATLDSFEYMTRNFAHRKYKWDCIRCDSSMDSHGSLMQGEYHTNYFVFSMSMISYILYHRCHIQLHPLPMEYTVNLIFHLMICGIKHGEYPAFLRIFHVHLTVLMLCDEHRKSYATTRQKRQCFFLNNQTWMSIACHEPSQSYNQIMMFLNDYIWWLHVLIDGNMSHDHSPFCLWCWNFLLVTHFKQQCVRAGIRRKFQTMHSLFDAGLLEVDSRCFFMGSAAYCVGIFHVQPMLNAN